MSARRLRGFALVTAVSLVLVPEGFIPMHDDAATHAFATQYLVPLLGPE